MNKKYRIQIEDGKYVEMDVTSKILRAIKRADRALKAGRGPTLDDTELIQQWLEEQHNKYGGIMEQGNEGSSM